MRVIYKSGLLTKILSLGAAPTAFYEFDTLSEYLGAISQEKIKDERFYLRVKKAMIDDITFSMIGMGFSLTERAHLIVKDEKGNRITADAYSATTIGSLIEPVYNWNHLKFSQIGDEIKFKGVKLGSDDIVIVIEDVHNFSLEKRKGLKTMQLD